MRVLPSRWMIRGPRKANTAQAEASAGSGLHPDHLVRQRAEEHGNSAEAQPPAPVESEDIPKGVPKDAEDSGALVGIGLATVDMLCVAPRMSERIVELSVFSMQGGGTMGNTLAAAGALGGRARFFGRVGNDDFGRSILGGLEACGVDCSLVAVEPDAISPMSVVQIDELSRKRKILTTKGNTQTLSTADLPMDLLSGAGLVVIDGYQPALQAAIAEKARARGVPVLLNASHLGSSVGELLTVADVVIGSERFAAEIAPSDRIEHSLSEICKLGPSCAVITLGDAGAIGLQGESFVRQDCFDVFVADTTGAGDVFCGAFAYSFHQGWRLERALPFANCAAGLSCRAIGARAGVPTRAEVEQALTEAQSAST